MNEVVLWGSDREKSERAEEQTDAEDRQVTIIGGAIN